MQSNGIFRERLEPIAKPTCINELFHSLFDLEEGFPWFGYHSVHQADRCLITTHSLEAQNASIVGTRLRAVNGSKHRNQPKARAVQKVQ